MFLEKFYYRIFLTVRKSIGTFEIRFEITTCDTDVSERELLRWNNPFIFALTTFDANVNALCFDDDVDDDIDEVDADN